MKRQTHLVLLFSFVLLGLIASGTVAVRAESFDLTTLGRFDADSRGAYWGVEGDFALESDLLSAYADLEFMNDGEWLPTESWMPEGVFFDLKYGYFTLDFDRLVVDGGFIPATHLYSQNPYELILDGSGKPAVGASYRYEGDLFAYQSRWIALNRMSPFVYEYSDDKWTDRGFNHKLYTLRLGDWRVGYQESSVFLDRAFDANFFLNPAPSILVNTLWSQQALNPWIMEVNDSSFMGFYGEYESGPVRVEAELMIKDVNLPFGYPTNLNKLAWSGGGTWDSPYGALSFWHGGATKHIYAATYQRPNEPNLYPYEYTYYPSSLLRTEASDVMVIDLTDNYIGFPFGENSLAFQVSWADTLLLRGMALDSSAALEYVISGSKSPHNPWHEFTSHTEIDNKTELFTDEDVLEHRLLLNASASTEIRNFVIRLDIGLGAIFNPLELVPQSGEAGIWRPASGELENISTMKLSIGYRFTVE